MSKNDTSAPLLPRVNSPQDLKRLRRDELPRLAAEITELIKTVVEENGGHYSSPLGVVDLTIALHYIFDSPRDKLVWDVGHQAYPHKILTGRRDQFHTLRTKDGISGFLKRSESEHDAFGAGHASTAISAALGMAEAMRLHGDDGRVVAIVGDGALTGGMAYEGLNNLGFKRMNMAVVLNDNRMSISPSVGSLSKYLTRVVTNPLYNRFRDDIWKAIGILPRGKRRVRKVLRKMEEGLKNFLTPGILFEELGLRYFGPIDGHDYESMLSVFSRVKDMPYPTLIHVVTEKGRGADDATTDSLKYYSLPGRRSKVINDGSAPDYNQVFGQVAVEMAGQDERICCVTAAMAVGTGLTEFSQRFPQRYFDVGIAEEHAVTFSAGLATRDMRPILAIYSTFLQRGFDQVVHDIALQDLPVIFCLDRAGVVGPDGPTHHGVFDLSFLRLIPGMVVCAPRNGNELRDLMFSAVQYDSPVSIRYPKDNSLSFDEGKKPEFIERGRWDTLRKGDDLAILAVGSMVPVAESAAEILEVQSGFKAAVVNARFIKPMDRKVLDSLVRDRIPIFTLEEGILAGGFGSGVRDYVATRDNGSKVCTFGIEDEFTEHGSRKELLDGLGLAPEMVVESITSRLTHWMKKA